MKAALLILLICTMPALAQSEGEFPGLFRVTGVEADDTLNVRAAAGVAHQIIGTLAHDATDIEIVRPDEHGGWGLINLGERTGWVSLDFLERHEPGSPDGFPSIRQCFGTEPFWSLHLDSEGIAEFMEPDAESTIATVTWRVPSSSRPGHFALGLAGNTESSTALITRASCSDGMSDREYGLAVDLVRDMDDGEVRLLSGCCSLAVAK